MLDSNSILQLFGNVLKEDIARYEISEKDIRRAVLNMNRVYAAQTGSLQSTSVNVANYNDAAHRCAYLHKYASFHTAMVQDVMFRVLKRRRNLFKTITSSEEFRICSLGGGPGNDVVGVIAALNTIFCTFKVHVTVVDLMEQWKLTFSSVIAELSNGNYGTLRTNVAENFLQWNYICADLLGKMTNPVEVAISQASLVILVKFVSAAACKGTEKMIKRIFRVMKPESLLLFIDNAGGGFRHLVQKAANKYKCETVFGPLNYNEYCNESLKNERFGYTSCFATTVTVHLLQKSIKQQSRTFYGDFSVSSDSENDNISSAVTCITKPVNEKKVYSHSRSTLSHNYNGLYQTPYLPGNVNNNAILVPSYQRNASMFSDVRVTAKPVSARKINPQSNLSTSQNKTRVFQNSKLPASAIKDNIPASSHQKNANISNDVTSSQKSASKKKINSQTDLLPSHNTPLFQGNFSVRANTPSTSQTVNNFDKSVSSPKNISVKSNNQRVMRPKAIPTSTSPLLHDSTSAIESKVYTSSRSDNASSVARRVTKPINEKKVNPQSNSSLSHNYYGLYQNAYLPGSVNKDTILVPSYQQPANISSDVTLTAKPVSAREINPQSNSQTFQNKPMLNQNTKLFASVNKDAILVPSYQQTANISSDVTLTAKPVSAREINPQSNSQTSQNNTRLNQSAKLPASVNKDYIPVSSDKKNTSISNDVTSSQKSTNNKKKINSQTDLSPSHTSPLFQDDFPINFPVRVNTPSTSQTVNSFDKSVSSPQNSSVESNNLPVIRSEAIPTSDNSLHDNTSDNSLHDNTSATESNVYNSPRRPNDTVGSYTALPTNSNRTSLAVPPQSQSNAFPPEPEDNSYTCCSCCGIS